MTDPEPLRRFVPLEHVQQELSIAYTQALALVRSGQLRAIKVGGRGQWRVSLETLEEYVQARYAKTAAMVAEESGDELPAPACEYGYPLNQLIDVLGEEHRELLMPAARARHVRRRCGAVREPAVAPGLTADAATSSWASSEPSAAPPGTPRPQDGLLEPVSGIF